MSPKRRRSNSPVEYKEGRDKVYETSERKDSSRDLEEMSNPRSGRGEFGRNSDRYSHGTSRESRRHDDHRRYHDKHAEDYGRNRPRASRSDRESRGDAYYDRSKRDSTSGRSRGDWRDVDRRYEEKPVNREQRSKNEEKQEYSTRGYGDDREDAEKRDNYRVVGKNKEIVEGQVLKKRNGKEIEKEPEVETREKRRSLFSSVADTKLSSTANEALDSSASVDAGATDGVNAAKVAAMKAAELVNRNIAAFGAGTGRLTTDQKKKLLWGNKKSNPPEESSARWDLNLFSDRERQEKFNKLMGVKGSAPVQENKAENKDGSSEAKKLEELDTNLEKHYIAGLRRRDGRTVGLGL
ncbi:hypothetical protein ACP70R_043709 [Stipagrostis hirtigluma subsp. patula]